MCAQRATDADIVYAFKTISRFADDMFDILKLDSKAREQEDEYNREQNKNAAPEKEEVSIEVMQLSMFGNTYNCNRIQLFRFRPFRLMSH